MYYCKDCSYEGKRAVQGRCPACGSVNISRKTAPEEQTKHSPWQLALLIMLWSLLFWLIYQNLQSN